MTWPLQGDLKVDDTKNLTDAEILEHLAAVHDAIRVLRAAETSLAGDLGARVGKGKGDLPDGRQYELSRTTDRKEWDHAEWKRDARRVLTTQLTERYDGWEAHGGVQIIDTQTGEVVTLGNVIQEAMAAIQNVQGSSPPKSTALKPLGLYASDYCTSTPGGWRFNAIEPTTTTEETATDA